MKNNILGGLVIFMVVVTCLLMLDDISQPQEQQRIKKTAQVDHMENQNDLAVVESDE